VEIDYSSFDVNPGKGMRLSLITKLTILTSLILVACMSLFAYVNLTELRRLFLEEAAMDTEKLSETIIKTTHYQMLINDLPRVYEMIREVGTQESIDQIRLISKSGRIIFSTNESELGSLLDKNAEFLSMFNPDQNAKAKSTPRKKSRIFSDKSGKQLMGLSKAIYNEESCFTSKCHFHPENLRVLGILDVTVSLEKMQKQLDSYRIRFITMTFILLILVWIGITLCMQRMVNIPVQQLLRHAREVGSGNLNAEAKIASDDEMGTLGSVMNEMTLGLKKSHAQLEDWGRTLEGKVAERTQELERMQAQLVRSEKLASLGELVAGIAHEINNPLTGILVFSSLIKNDSRLDPVLIQDLDTVIQETERCATIVKGLLDFARETVPQKTWTLLNDILDASLSLVRNQAFFQNITIIRDFSEEIPSILADPNQLEQVFINMLLNAGHAMISGGTLRITTAKDPETNGVVARVADTGCGIPEENLAKIFDPFFTTKESSGTGLGLSVSYGIINSHGGTIEVESAVGIGTTFTIKLPINPDVAHETGETRIPREYTVW
jgi:two-component system NtrC family sensor kinase